MIHLFIVTAKPDISHCLVTVHGSRGLHKAHTDINCGGDIKAVVYTNVIPSMIKVGIH